MTHITQNLFWRWLYFTR